VVVHDVDEARAFYVDVLDGVPLDDQESSVADVDGHFVLVGDDTVIELVHPRDPSSLLARELDTVGQCVTGVTFKVRDVERASEHDRARLRAHGRRARGPPRSRLERRLPLHRRGSPGPEGRPVRDGVRPRLRPARRDPRAATWNLWGRGKLANP
jgi:catechol 2,3-dioxygenase-like lactoylglutathione lyase family enzyme